MKVGKAASSWEAADMDDCAVECLKDGGMCIIEWLATPLNVCFVLSVVPADWMSVFVV